MSNPDRYLVSTTDTRAADRHIRRAARLRLNLAAARIQTDFEHGQWWVTDLRTGAQWAAVDHVSVNGFPYVTFEMVSEGDHAWY